MALALNEVGGDPAADALPPDTFHALMLQRAGSSPHGLTATATHDTKRGEDARARLLALPELAGEWTACVGRWKAMNAKHVETRNGMRSPSPAFEYLLYQSLIGAWPLSPDPAFGDRMKAYAIKAAREAKRETSWLNPNEPYEKGLTDFIDRILDPSNSDFLQSISVLVRQLSLLGALNTLSQITLKTTMPGVPDFYQGTEFWDFSLVDPDNRRALDFTERREALKALSTPDWQDLTDNWTNGRLKLAWTAKLLDTRRSLDGVFRFGSYHPIEVQGPAHEHVIAYARQYRGEAAIVAVGRRFARLTDRGQHWPLNVFDGALDTSGFEVQMPSGEKISSALSLATIFPHVPAAVLPARKSGNQR